MLKSTLCVLVLYNSNQDLLQKAIRSIINQIDTLYIVDNSIGHTLPELYFRDFDGHIIYHPLMDNIGIAAAQNVGLKYALENKYDFIYYLDQDSISPNNIINTLIFEYKLLKSSGVKVGGIGPRAVNRQSNKDYRGSVKKGNTINENITEVTELISSASLIEVDTFRAVGLMDESLFIDGVDHDWCWRAKQAGEYRFFIAENVKLSHQLGEGDRRFLFIKVAVPTPFRTYYQFRNYFWLIRRNYVPTYWKLSNGFKYLIKLFYYPICISPRRDYLANILKGMIDGILKKNN